MSITNILPFVLLGTLGGISHVLVDSKDWSDLSKYESFKDITISTIVGFLYYFLHSSWSFPNGIMAFVSGYTGSDFILKLLEKRGEKKDAQT